MYESYRFKVTRRPETLYMDMTWSFLRYLSRYSYTIFKSKYYEYELDITIESPLIAEEAKDIKNDLEQFGFQVNKVLRKFDQYCKWEEIND